MDPKMTKDNTIAIIIVFLLIKAKAIKSVCILDYAVIGGYYRDSRPAQ